MFRTGRVASAVVGSLVVAVVGATLAGSVASAAPASSTSNSAGIEALQRELNSLSCNAGPVDGKLGGDTEAAIRWFQTAAGVTVDGIVGPITSAKLTQAVATGSPTCVNVPKPPAPPKPSAGPPCTQAIIQAAATAGLLVNERLVLGGPYQCVGVWTYNAPTITSASGPQQQVITLLRWSGTAWQVTNRALYCENGSVPGQIYQKTCLAGSPLSKNKNASDAAGIEFTQRQLNALSCNAGTDDGTFGPNTLRAVRWFQAAAGITVDGIVGPATNAKLSQGTTTGSPSCKGVPEPPAPPTTTKPSGAGPPCTQALIQAAAQAALLPGEKIVKSGPYQCAGIWTYNAPTISSASGAQSQVIDLMRWNGTAWQVVNRALYCENGSVPGLIYQKTCQK